MMKRTLLISLLLAASFALSACSAQGKRCDMLGNCRQQIAWDEI